MTSKNPLYFVFDVESIGLHGEGFAVGFVVVDGLGNRQDYDLFSCDPKMARGSMDGHEWVKNNCPVLPLRYEATWQMRAAFWHKWQEWKQRGSMLVADCCWPVETRFLSDCVRDNPMEREWQGPYPLYDLAWLCLACGKDPTAKRERLDDELPEHNPLNDARQSARILVEMLQVPTPFPTPTGG